MAKFNPVIRLAAGLVLAVGLFLGGGVLEEDALRLDEARVAPLSEPAQGPEQPPNLLSEPLVRFEHAVAIERTIARVDGAEPSLRSLPRRPLLLEGRHFRW